MSEITTEQLKEKLTPILEKIYCFAQVPKKLEERKMWADVYKSICSLVEEDKPEPSPRDTQFAGFANLLFDETGKATSNAHMKHIIAQRAHDLVQHTIGYSLEYIHECGIELSGSMGSRIVPSIPDMTTLPEVQE